MSTPQSEVNQELFRRVNALDTTTRGGSTVPDGWSVVNVAA